MGGHDILTQVGAAYGGEVTCEGLKSWYETRIKELEDLRECATSLGDEDYESALKEAKEIVKEELAKQDC